MDYEPPTPVERVLSRSRWIRFLAILLLLVAAVYYFVFVKQYVAHYAQPEEHFKYGSIGSEADNGIPVLVFKALAVMYRDELGPSGYRRFGLLYENERSDLPIGMSTRTVMGVERVWLNCAVCHVGTLRKDVADKPDLIYGAPSNNLRLYGLIKFFLKAGADPKFNADNLITAINSPEVGGHQNVFERLIYRYIVFPRVQAGLAHLAQEFTFLGRQGDDGGGGRAKFQSYYDWGPGRVDTFNPYKAIQFNFPMDAAHISLTELNGASDFPSIWAQHPRDGMHLHWDGNNTSVDERNLSAALGAGVTPVTVDTAAIKRVRDYIWDKRPPPYPTAKFPLDPASNAVKQGRDLFANYCAGCHGMKEIGASDYNYDTNRYPRLGQIEKLEKIGTDPDRWQSYTQNFSAAQNTLYAGYPWRFSHFSKTAGYANQPLDGIWARSPYLHNGSVPTLRDLLEPASKRPATWQRGSDIFDPVKVGYRSDGYGAAREDVFVYDTSVPGNSNSGHDYGTELSGAEKEALVEYMKTL
ncbi:c-type cytochrome [Bradyrhizobium sp. CCGUVB23]|uniref:c-type cytochrome n=1 Tax=Bradyrhizobium sp. CCGUVB23 TaxID=2949630 RepID=UPI0020B2A7D5|nr:c-type cytochrome [Bradyrhizobium sp. CCGUVB23]MCP3463505.1 c-type cytochrome [Bradyrhizobium sp. CCGUVB23]